jgi:chromate transporter
MSTTPATPEAIGAGSTALSPAPVSFSGAFWFWFKLGFISFGGPAGQIAIMHQELVEKRRWISEGRFLHALNYCMVLPGPEAQQLATYIGWLMHRTLGGIVAGGLFVLPSLFILILLSWVYVTFGNLPTVSGILYGIKPAVTAIVLFAAYRIGSRALNNAVLSTIAAIAFIAIFAFQIPFPWIVLGAGVAGAVGGRFAPTFFSSGGHQKAKIAYGPAIIDDHTPTPEHARFTWPRLLSVIGIGVALWAAAMALLIALFGAQGMLANMAWFFTKAALLTFGGAYAVLPYVFQGAVESFGWLAPTQMIDGLALGETTPGPLIMVVAFVGFVGGWSAEMAVGGASDAFLAGTVAASVVTYFTFLPSFIFILAGGPIIETTHRQPRVTAPLSAITAAVVGVIVNLATFFAYHVLWPAGFTAPFEWPALLIGIIASVALFRFRVGVIPIILGCGAAGLVYQLAIRTLLT